MPDSQKTENPKPNWEAIAKSLLDDIRNARDEIHATNQLYKQELQENTAARRDFEGKIEGVETALDRALVLLDGTDEKSVVARLRVLETHIKDHCDELEDLRTFKRDKEQEKVTGLEKSLKEAKRQSLGRDLLVASMPVFLVLLFAAVGWFLYLVFAAGGTPPNSIQP